MKIYDIIQPKPSDIPISEVLPGAIVQSFASAIFILTNVSDNVSNTVTLVNLEDGIACEWMKKERNFTLRTDIVLTTDCNLRNRPE